MAGAGTDSRRRGGPGPGPASRGDSAERWAFERRLAGGPERLLCGVDEVGRGPLAGPVVAAAVVLRPEARLTWATDSKLLDHAGRLRAIVEIASAALAISWRAVSARRIDQVNIREASFQAMRGAVTGLCVRPAVIVTDGEVCPRMPHETVGFPKADLLVPAVSAASIVAKLVRDAWMEDLARFHPHYGFEKHRGYPTPEHLEALRRLGACPEHRRSFAPVRELDQFPLFS